MCTLLIALAAVIAYIAGRLWPSVDGDDTLRAMPDKDLDRLFDALTYEKRRRLGKGID